MKNSLQFSHLQKSCHFKMLPWQTTFSPMRFLHIVLLESDILMVHFYIGWILDGAMSHALSNSIKDPERANSGYCLVWNWWLLPALPLLAVCGLQNWLQLGFVAIHTFQPAIRGPEKTSFDFWCNFYFIHLAYCSPETPHECSILRSSCTVDTFTSIHNMDMI